MFLKGSLDGSIFLKRFYFQLMFPENKSLQWFLSGLFWGLKWFCSDSSENKGVGGFQGELLRVFPEDQTKGPFRTVKNLFVTVELRNSDQIRPEHRSQINQNPSGTLTQ